MKSKTGKILTEADFITIMKDIFMTDGIQKEHYTLLKDLFLNFTKTSKGPHRLQVTTLGKLYIARKAEDENILTISMVREVVDPIWRKMVEELCPYQLVISHNTNILESIKEVDDNINFIYTSSLSALDRTVRLLNLSNATTAYLLRVKNVR